MKYIALVYHEEAALEALTIEEHTAIIRECKAWLGDLEQSGSHVYSNGLQSTKAAATISERGGRITVTDGPFAETKEFLGGFTIFEARDLNDAIRIVSKLPATRIGRVEVRPVIDLDHEMADPLDQRIAQALRASMEASV